MNRLLRMSFLAVAAAYVMPIAAFARDDSLTPVGLHLTASATGLGVAIILLVEALGLRKIALGGAIAEKLHFVILAIVCLAASALSKWTSNFVDGVTFAQTELLSDLLVVLAMALLAGYFYSVRIAMQSYLSGMQAEQASPPSAAAPAEAPDDEAGETESPTPAEGESRG